jgi:putative mRNA 3-end processing factor
MRFEDLLRPTPKGLYCPPGGFHIDPVRPVERALVTHGHADHARPGHAHVMATRETLDIMGIRYGEDFAGATQQAAYGEVLDINGVTVSWHPAGHVLGAAQIAVEKDGIRIVASGDYKRRRDPTCASFEPVKCDVFITEATFGLPVFRHPDDREEIGKLLKSVEQFPAKRPSRRRLCARQGATRHRPAARGGLRQDHPHPRRDAEALRLLSEPRH